MSGSNSRVAVRPHWRFHLRDLNSVPACVTAQGAWLAEQIETGALPRDPVLVASLVRQAEEDPKLIARLIKEAKDPRGRAMGERDTAS